LIWAESIPEDPEIIERFEGDEAVSADSNVAGGPPGEMATSLHRGTDWRGAFVIGLAGVILVTGIVPFAVQAMGAAAIPAIIGIQVVAMAVCLCMGELAALYPHRTGGTPSYAYESFKPLGESAARHIGGVCGWSYWLGWFPVAPINMILAASYIAELFHVPLGRLVDPLGGLGTAEGIGVLAITMVGLVVLFIPCYLGIRLGAGFATLFGVISMVPLTLLIILPVFKPSTFHWSNVAGLHFANPKTAGVAFFLSWLFVISWNGIGVEAAACYVAECRDPHRDAKLALTAEGLYGLFIYAATAIVFVAVLGASLTSSDPLTLYSSFADHIFGSAHWVKYVIGIPLIGALLLSVLNAIMGVARSLFQASEDRLIPKFFAHKNKHHVPDRAMFFNLICAMIVALFGSPVRIYIFSNVGYLLAIVAALFGYFMVRQFRKDQISPFRLPGFFRWIALIMALGLTFVYFAGGWGSPDIVVGPGQGHTLYLLGFAVVAAYIPLHLWRRMTDRRDGVAPLATLPVVVGSPGGIDLGDTKEPHILGNGHVPAIDAGGAGIGQVPDPAPDAG
jgi:amino acid transporter